ncbi:MAG: hypothetical protein ACJAXJ_000133 [Colwellia sp.]|jgi:hypothetical protein
MIKHTPKEGMPRSGWSALKEKFILVALSIMAIGQWADTKALLVETYVDIVSNFTHHYEYEVLSTINIGSNLEYFKQNFGVPQLIKPSKYEEDVRFAYFLNDKYILTLILNKTRISAYTITALVEDFVPYGLLDKSPQTERQKISDKVTEIADYTLDYNNIEFVLVREQLDKSKLFINKYFGAIAYTDDIKLPSFVLKEISDALNFEDEESEAIAAKVKNLISETYNNYYGVGEVDLSLITDSILTKFEYSLYAKKPA